MLQDVIDARASLLSASIHSEDGSTYLLVIQASPVSLIYFFESIRLTPTRQQAVKAADQQRHMDTCISDLTFQSLSESLIELFLVVSQGAKVCKTCLGCIFSGFKVKERQLVADQRGKVHLAAL